MRRLVPLLAIVLLAGCAQPVAGSPAPVPDPAPTTSPAPELPPRPRDVPLDGVDPCSLLTEDDRAELGLDQPPILDVGLSALYGGEIRQCAIRGFEPRAISVSVLLSVTGGIELFFRPGVRSEITPIEVAGFPGIIRPASPGTVGGHGLYPPMAGTAGKVATDGRSRRPEVPRRVGPARRRRARERGRRGR